MGWVVGTVCLLRSLQRLYQQPLRGRIFTELAHRVPGQAERPNPDFAKFLRLRSDPGDDAPGPHRMPLCSLPVATLIADLGQRIGNVRHIGAAFALEFFQYAQRPLAAGLRFVQLLLTDQRYSLFV